MFCENESQFFDVLQRNFLIYPPYSGCHKKCNEISLLLHYKPQFEIIKISFEYNL